MLIFSKDECNFNFPREFFLLGRIVYRTLDLAVFTHLFYLFILPIPILSINKDVR